MLITLTFCITYKNGWMWQHVFTLRRGDITKVFLPEDLPKEERLALYRCRDYLDPRSDEFQTTLSKIFAREQPIRTPTTTR